MGLKNVSDRQIKSKFFDTDIAYHKKTLNSIKITI